MHTDFVVKENPVDLALIKVSGQILILMHRIFKKGLLSTRLVQKKVKSMGRIISNRHFKTIN